MANVLDKFTLLGAALALSLASFSCRSLSSFEDSKSRIQQSPLSSESKKHHCDDLPSDTKCLTIYLKIPKPTMIKDVGLSLLTMAAQSQALSPLVHDACQRGIGEFYLNELKLRMFPHVIRGAFARQKSRAQCVIVPLESFEDEKKPIVLHPNERAISVRLTQFEIEGQSSQAQLNLFKFSKKETKAHLKYRDASIGAGVNLKGEMPGKWQLLPALGPDQKQVSASFDQDIALNIDGKILERNLAKLGQKKKNESQAGLLSFLNNATQALNQSGSIPGSFVLIGMGFDLFNQACNDPQGKRDPELCGYVEKSGMKTEELSQGITLPSSQNSELLRSSLIHLTSSLLDQIFVEGDGRQIRRVFSF